MAQLVTLVSKALGGKLEFDQIVRYNERPGMDSEQSDGRDDMNVILRALGGK